MSRIEDLARAYEDHIGAPWQRTLSGAQRVMLVVYEKDSERALRARIDEFEQATRRTGHGWTLVDVTDWFAQWMAADEYRDAYFEDPTLLGMKLSAGFRQEAAQRLSAAAKAADDDSVVAVIGAASLYGFLRVSELIREIEPSIRGRLVVFFPGTKDANNYKLLDARDGWNYLAHGVTLHGGGAVL